MAIINWMGAPGGLWSVAGNWSNFDTGGPGVPTSGDDAEFRTDANATNGSTAVAARIELAGDAALTSSGSLTVGVYIRIGTGGSGTAQLLVTGGTVNASTIRVGFNNAGRLFVSGGSTVTGAIVVDNGAVIIGGISAASAGTINGTISFAQATDSLTFRTTNAASYGGNVSGAGSILIDSPGQTTTLTGDNSGHSGLTTVQAGALQVGTGGTLGTGNLVLLSGTALQLSRSDPLVLANAISGAGSLQLFGTTTAILTGANSYDFTFLSNGTTLQIGNDGTTGTLGAGAVNNVGTLAFQHAGGTYSHANAISGSGNLVVRGAFDAIEILTGNNNYTGTTTVQSGGLAVGQFGTSGTLGTGAVTIMGGAFLDLIRSDTQVVANAISGAGELRVYGNHTAILTGNNSYGNTTIFAGSTLQIGNGGNSGTLGTGAVTNDGTLVFNHVFDPLFGPWIYGNAIGGSGGVTVNSDEIEYLAGVNSYTGVTTINSGVLALQDGGSISNSASITLNGTGRFDISNISGASASVRDIFMTAAGTSITMSGQTLIVTHADLYAGPGRFRGSVFNDAVVFNVVSASYTLAGATTGAVFSDWTDGQDSITINGNASANTLTGDELQATTINGGAGNDTINGGAGNDVLNGDGNNDIIDASAGGDDVVAGGTEDDAIIFGSTLTALDRVDGGTGNDQLAISGDYFGGNALTLGATTLTNIEVLALLPGAGNNYNVISNNATVAAGQEMTIFAGNLGSGQNFFFDGSAETDGFFRTFGGLGQDVIAGGALSDGFYFGPNKWTAGFDVVVGQGGTNDQLALDGDYTITIDAAADVEVLVLLAGPVGTPNTFNITLANSWTSGGARTVFGRNVTTNMTINGAAEASANLTIFGGRGSDTLTSGGGSDTIYGLEGNDTITGGLGSDTAVYQGVRASYTVVTNMGSVQIQDINPLADGDDGIDTVVGIEFARFSDQTISITSPIILDLDGGGVETLSAAQSNAAFDMDGDGIGDDTSWFGHGEGLLFLDRDGNGTLSNAGEMSFTGDVANARSDLEGLAAWDSNGDGQLSSADARFSSFKIWQDRNSNGVVDRREVMTLARAGVRSLSLSGTANNGTYALGDTAIVNTGSFIRTNGRTGGLIDAVLTAVSSKDTGDQNAAAMLATDDPLTAMRSSMAAVDTSAPDTTSFDTRVSMMTQDMASFGASERNGVSQLEQYRRFDSEPAVLFAV